MGWVFYGEAPVGFEERVVGDFLIGDELIRVEHLFAYETFPGFGYALLSNIYANDERDFFRRSYPQKNSSRIYEVKVPPQLFDAGYGLHQLLVRCNVRARLQSDANWRIRISVWVDGGDEEPPVDGQAGGGGDDVMDGNP